jgi:hypothetical protein
MRAACSDGTSIELKFQIETRKFCLMPVVEEGQLVGIVRILAMRTGQRCGGKRECNRGFAEEGA